MNDTLQSRDRFHQERYCSYPEFDGDVISGLAAAKRISIVKDPLVRRVLWWLQWLSLTDGALQGLCDQLIATFPAQLGTPTLRRLQIECSDRLLTPKEVADLRQESCKLSKGYLSSLFCGYVQPSSKIRVSAVVTHLGSRLRSLKDQLVAFCLDPRSDLTSGVWYFEDLFGALTVLRQKFIDSAYGRLADTKVSRKINETLDFWYRRHRMVLIEGVAGIGRTSTARAWCNTRAGMVRYIEVPSSSDDRSFFAALARQLGVARGTSFQSNQMKVRVEEMLASGDLCLIFDEAHYAWGGALRPRKTPDRILWIKTTFDAGTPIALIAHTDFSKWQKHFVARTLWTDEQFERRLNRRVVLPSEHPTEDMLQIARCHFPTGNLRSWKLLAAYAIGSEKKRASGIVEALESARYRAESSGRKEPEFGDIEAALIYDHGFLDAKPADVEV